MLRITLHEAAAELTFQLEGRLVGPWVREAADAWQRAVAQPRPGVVRVDLTGVTVIDAAGKDLLAAAHAQGAELVASGCLMRAIVADVTKSRFPECECR